MAARELRLCCYCWCIVVAVVVVGGIVVGSVMRLGELVGCPTKCIFKINIGFGYG